MFHALEQTDWEGWRRDGRRSIDNQSPTPLFHIFMTLACVSLSIYGERRWPETIRYPWERSACVRTVNFSPFRERLKGKIVR